MRDRKPEVLSAVSGALFVVRLVVSVRQQREKGSAYPSLERNTVSFTLSSVRKRHVEEPDDRQP